MQPDFWSIGGPDLVYEIKLDGSAFGSTRRIERPRSAHAVVTNIQHAPELAWAVLGFDNCIIDSEYAPFGCGSGQTRPFGRIALA